MDILIGVVLILGSIFVLTGVGVIFIYDKFFKK